jgi:hypothetical protein
MADRKASQFDPAAPGEAIKLLEDGETTRVEGARVGMSRVTGGGVSGVDHGACTMHVLGV